MKQLIILLSCHILLISFHMVIAANIHHHKHEDHSVENHHHNHANHLLGNHPNGDPNTPSGISVHKFDVAVWTKALLTTAFLGAAPVLILTIIPIGYGNLEKQQPTIRVFLGFAAGGLLGDTFLHLLPHSIPHHSHSHSHSNTESHHEHNVSGHSHSFESLFPWCWTLVGIISFLIIEKFVKCHTTLQHSHSTTDSNCRTKQNNAKQQYPKDITNQLRERNVGKAIATDQDDSSPKVIETQISAAGYLNLVADFTHNFTDGLALGATFEKGNGWQTAIAILIHEIPHEIGDFAILIQSGFSRKRAMLAQLLTALGALSGTVIGLTLGQGDGDSWAIPFTAGGFIYIATCTIFPELLETNDPRQSLKEVLAICFGITLMVAITLFE